MWKDEVHLCLGNDTPSSHPDHAQIRAIGPRVLHHKKGRGLLGANGAGLPAGKPLQDSSDSRSRKQNPSQTTLIKQALLKERGGTYALPDSVDEQSNPLAAKLSLERIIQSIRPGASAADRPEVKDFHRLGLLSVTEENINYVLTMLARAVAQGSIIKDLQSLVQILQLVLQMQADASPSTVDTSQDLDAASAHSLLTLASAQKMAVERSSPWWRRLLKRLQSFG